MRPALAPIDVANDALFNAEQLSNLILRKAPTCSQFANCKDVAHVELRAIVRFAAHHCSMDILAPMIRRACLPTQIAYRVIAWISIEMRTFMPIWGRANEGLKNDPVKIPAMAAPISSEHDASIVSTMKIAVQFEDFLNSVLEAFHAPKIGYHVFRMFFDYQPCFHNQMYAV